MFAEEPFQSRSGLSMFIKLRFISGPSCICKPFQFFKSRLLGGLVAILQDIIARCMKSDGQIWIKKRQSAHGRPHPGTVSKSGLSLSIRLDGDTSYETGETHRGYVIQHLGPVYTAGMKASQDEPLVHCPLLVDASVAPWTQSGIGSDSRLFISNGWRSPSPDHQQ